MKRKRRRHSFGQSADLCAIPRNPSFGGRRVFDTSAGVEGLRYLQERTRRDPFFAFASAFMHAGQITYQIQQPIIEQLVADPEARKELRDPYGAERMLLKKYKGAIYATKKAKDFPFVMHCFDKHCGADGQACVGSGGKLPARAILAMRCLVKQRTEIGQKSRNLLAEYLGCDQAVAVDRHVANWLANSVGTLAWAQRRFYPREHRNESCPAPFKPAMLGPMRRPICEYEGRVRFVKETVAADKLNRQGIPATAKIDPTTFAMMKREIQRLAGRCGKSAAELQVAAWAQGACTALKEEGFGDKLNLGAGNVLDCNKVPTINLGPPDKGWKLNLRPLASPPHFRCKAGYLGQAGEAEPPATSAEEVELVDGPVKAPPGRKLLVDPKLRPVVPEERLPAWLGPGVAADIKRRAARFVPMPGERSSERYAYAGSRR